MSLKNVRPLGFGVLFNISTAQCTGKDQYSSCATFGYFVIALNNIALANEIMVLILFSAPPF